MQVKRTIIVPKGNNYTIRVKSFSTNKPHPKWTNPYFLKDGVSKKKSQKRKKTIYL